MIRFIKDGLLPKDINLMTCCDLIHQGWSTAKRRSRRHATYWLCRGAVGLQFFAVLSDVAKVCCVPEGPSLRFLVAHPTTKAKLTQLLRQW